MKVLGLILIVWGFFWSSPLLLIIGAFLILWAVAVDSMGPQV